MRTQLVHGFSQLHMYCSRCVDSYMCMCMYNIFMELYSHQMYYHSQSVLFWAYLYIIYLYHIYISIVSHLLCKVSVLVVTCLHTCMLCLISKCS